MDKTPAIVPHCDEGAGRDGLCTSAVYNKSICMQPKHEILREPDGSVRGSLVNSEAKLESEVEDPFAGWSNTQRLAEYRETGNADCLTESLMKELGVWDFYQNPEKWDHEIRKSDDAVLIPYNADSVSLEAIGVAERIKRLLPLASLRKRTATDDLEFVRDVAQARLFEVLLDNEESVYRLFDCLHYDNPEGLRELAVAEVLRNMAHNFFVSASHDPNIAEADKEKAHKCARVLNEFVAVSNGFLDSTEALSDTKYLFIERAHAFSKEISGLSPEIDLEQIVPFEISAGRYAVFTEDRQRIYIADSDLSKEVAQVLKQHEDDIYFEEVGQYFARYTRERVPEEIHDITDSILDSGVPLESELERLFIEDKSLVDDYVHMMRSSVRQVIEEDFSVSLKDLNLREQLLFLSFLKNVSIDDVDQIKAFAARYGETGIRAFVALDQLGPMHGWVIAGNALGANVMGKGEVMQKVLAEYVDLDSRVQDSEEYLSKNFNSHDRAVVHEMVTGMRQRAVSLFTQLQQEVLIDPGSAEQRISAASTRVEMDAALFTTAFRLLRKQGDLKLEDVKNGSLEVLAGPDLSERDREVFLKVQVKHYQNKYPEKLMAELRAGLLNAFENPECRLYVYRHDGDPVTFVRFEPGASEVEVHMGSFMTTSAYEGGRIGQAMLEAALEKEGAGKKVVAECDPGLVSFYERFGFRRVRCYKDSYGVDTCDIERA